MALPAPIEIVYYEPRIAGVGEVHLATCDSVFPLPLFYPQGWVQSLADQLGVPLVVEKHE